MIEYEAYINSDEWADKRRDFLASGLPTHECQACGKPRETGFHVHHRTYQRLGNEHLTDLVLLCPRCHQDLHRAHKRFTRLSVHTKKWIKRKRGLPLISPRVKAKAKPSSKKRQVVLSDRWVKAKAAEEARKEVIAEATAKAKEARAKANTDGWFTMSEYQARRRP